MCTSGPGTATAFRKSHFHSFFHFKPVVRGLGDFVLSILVQLVPPGGNSFGLRKPLMQFGHTLVAAPALREPTFLSLVKGLGQTAFYSKDKCLNST